MRRPPRFDRLLAARDRARSVSRGAAVDTEEAVPAAGRPARRLSLGRRRARQELPDGRLLRDGRDPAQDARPLPCVHARRYTRSSPRFKRRGGSARDRRRAHRAPAPARLLRRVPRLRHRRRDDPRAPAHGAVRARRRVRDDVELSAGRAVARRAAARALPADDRAPEGVARRRRGRRRRRLPTASAGAGRDVYHDAARCPTPMPRSRPRSSGCAAARTRIRKLAIEGRPLARAAARRQRRRGSTSRRCATVPARSATTSSSPGSFPVLFLSGVPAMSAEAWATARGASPGSSTSCTIIA